MRVLIDVDGVLADFVSGALAHVGGRLKEHDITAYDMVSLMTKAEVEAFRSIAITPGFCYNLKPYEGARIALDRLRSQGHDVRIVTAPFRGSRTWYDERLQWLRDKMGVDEDHVIFAGKKEKPFIGGHVLIEDHGPTLEEWQKEQVRTSGILIRRPWNAGTEYFR